MQNNKVTVLNSSTVGLIFISLAMISSNGFAVPPGKANCSGDVYERLKCRSDAISGQLTYTDDMAFAEGTRLSNQITDERRAHISNARIKAENGKSRTNKAKFKKYARNESRSHKDEIGHFMPLSSADDMDANGICDFEEGNEDAECLAVELDEDGATQACNPYKRNKGKSEGLECDVFYDSEDEADVDLVAEEMEANFIAVESDLMQMNEQLDIANATEENISSASSDISVAASETSADGGCEIPDASPGLSEAVAALRTIAATVKGAGTIYDAASDQVFVVLGSGGNIASSATAFHYASLAAEIAYIVTDEVYQAEISALQAATTECVVKSADAIAETGEKIDDVIELLNALQAQILASKIEIKENDDANTSNIQTDIENTRSELSDLLNTPQGKREWFNRN
ncbi:MAG: hypothetical protein KAS48_02735 [Gammaproteobacteria bacterium]|nr:hypothetical protein [Gammaproteobacteria bacterium]MCK5090988.1 hypothetical protein [Gammaproteobacteria bacterium]